MRYFVITDDRDTLTGLRLAGIEGALAGTRPQVEGLLKDVAADAEIAILLISEACAALCGDMIAELKLSAERPLVTVIPDSGGTVREKDSITRLIREAIGIRI